MKKYMVITILSLIIFNCQLSILNCQSWKELIDSTEFYQKKRDYETSLKWSILALPQAEKEFGKVDTNYRKSLYDLISNYIYLEKYDKAIEFAKEDSLICYKLFGDKHIEYANLMSAFAEVYEIVGSFNNSANLLNIALPIYKVQLGEKNGKYADATNFLARIYKSLGRYKEAEELFLKSINIKNEIFGDSSKSYAVSLNNLSRVYYETGRYEEAEKILKKSCEIVKKEEGEDSYAYAINLNDLAMVYDDLGKYFETEILLKKVIAIVKKVNGEEHSEYATVLNSLGLLYYRMGRYTEAEDFLKKSTLIRKRTLGLNHPYYSSNLNHLAMLYSQIGRSTEAEKLFKEALKIDKAQLGENQYYYLSTVNNLASLYSEMGRYSEAVELLTYSLRKIETNLGDSTSLYTIMLHNLADATNHLGNNKEAEILYNKTLEHHKKYIGENNPNYIKHLISLSYIYTNHGRYSESDSILKIATVIANAIQENNLTLLVSVNTAIGYLNYRLGNFSEAEKSYLKALEISSRLYGEEHAECVEFYDYLGKLYLETHSLGKSEPMFLKSLKLNINVLNSYFPALSDKEKKQFWKTVGSIFEVFNTFASERAKQVPAILCNMYDTRLYTKALMLNSANRVKNRIMNSNDSTLIEVYKKWQDLKEYLVTLYKKSDTELIKKNINLDSIEKVANELEKNISLKSEDFKQSYEKKKVTWKSIQTLLKPDEAAVEVVRYRLFKNKHLADTIFYAFLIVTDQTEEHPDIIVIENGKELENEYYNDYRNFIKTKVKDTLSFNRFWAKLHNKLKGYKKIYFSADGIYNKLNPSTLMMPNGKYILDYQDVQQVNSTKDLLLGYYRTKEESNIYNSAVLVGNPNFALSEDKVMEIRSKIRSEKQDIDSYEQLASVRGIELTRLPGTEKEVKDIEKFFKNKKWEVKTYLGDMAVKSAVKTTSSPRVLHIATHGLFLEDIKRGGKEIFGFEEQKMVENPLLRSGLFFTGADNYIKKENPGFIEEDNGLLTAYEAMNLNLDRTELVVLSACETGLGEIQNGEGVFGLRSAFQQAGARNVLMSLWKVDDASTQELMTNFYSNWVTGMTKRDAFSKAQQEVRSKYKDPYYWGAFVMVGE